MELDGRFSSVSEAMEYFMPFRILGSYKVNDGHVFWSTIEEDTVAQVSIEERIRRVLISTSFRRYKECSIVQFWGVKRIAVSKCMLTTSHQPFGIYGLDKSYYSYRKECMRRNVDVGPEADEVQLGPAGRAFRNRSVEYSPHIQSNTIQEFPLRDHAILCHLRSLMCLPVFELDSNNIVGVLELLSSRYNSSYRDDHLAIELQEVGLRINFNESSESMDREKVTKEVAKDIHYMFMEVAKTHPLALGLAFFPCRKEHCLKCYGTGCNKPIAVYRDPHMRSLDESSIKTNGISRRAYASGKSCFCRDIRNFSILECPLAHHARLAGLTFSFATCVQSIQEESCDVLVLEFLLLPGRYDIENIRVFTRSLLTKIKELLPYYMVAVEDFPGEQLFPKNYDSLEYDVIDHVQVGDNPLSLPVTCDDVICYLGNEEAVIDFFLPINLSCEGSSDDEENKCHTLVFWRKDVETCNGMSERIKLVFKHVPMKTYDVELVQFWAPTRIAGKCFLTTHDHPFVIGKLLRKLTCLYRIECMRHKIYVDEEGSNEKQLGPAGRAFKNGVVECSPDVKLYTIKEFPLRDHAVLWGIKGAMFLPVFELHGKDTIGVLEILYSYQWELGTYLNNLTMELKKMGLRIDYVHPQPDQSDPLAKIEKIFEPVFVRYPLRFARMLTLSQTDYCHNNSSQEYISRIWSRRLEHFDIDGFLVACSFHQLPDKNGVAGKALKSQRSCFCMNIGKWGIKDYFLSHYVELCGCNFSVAICVENTLLVDTPCVVEFFLLPGDYSNEYIGGLLDSLLTTVKEHLPPNFKILSEDVPGEPFFLEIGKTIENGSKAIISRVHDAAGGMNSYNQYTLSKQTISEVPSSHGLLLEMLDKVERKFEMGMSAIEMRVTNIEQRLVDMEKNIPDSKKMESKIVQRLTNVAKHHFEVSKYKLNKELRAELNMNPPAEEEAPEIFNVDDDVGENSVEVVLNTIRKVYKSKRTSEGTPGTLSPCTNPDRRKKAKMEMEMIVEPLPVPFKGPDDCMIDISKDDMLVEWIKKNNHPRQETKIGLATGCYGNGLYEYITAHNLSKIRDDGWLDNSDLDCFLQLLMSQAEAYPDAFKSHRWTCLGMLYEKEVKAQYNVFKESRTINRQRDPNEQENKDFDWETISDQLYKFVMGTNENWMNKPWSEVDFVYGVQNIGTVHWAAFEYDLKKKVINVYDSLKTRFRTPRKEAFERHAAILPGLVNLFCEKKEDKLNLDVPFKIKYLSCPQQQNGHDCGVYALKFIQCLCMGDDILDLVANRFPAFRKKIVQDLLKWKRSPDGSKVAFEEVAYDMHAADEIGETTPVRPQPSSNQMEGNKFHVTLDQLKLQYGNTLDEAAKNLGVSRSTLKRIRESHGIRRWPSHEKNIVNPSLFLKKDRNEVPHIVSSEADSTHPVLPMQTCIHSTDDLQIDQHQTLSYRDSEVEKVVTIKASYGHNTFIMFKLNTRSTLHDLHEQVIKRLRWEANRFDIKYQDEAKDWIRIIIDEDLTNCLQASIDRGESTVSMSINLRLD